MRWTPYPKTFAASASSRISRIRRTLGEEENVKRGKDNPFSQGQPRIILFSRPLEQSRLYLLIYYFTRCWKNEIPCSLSSYLPMTLFSPSSKKKRLKSFNIQCHSIDIFTIQTLEGQFQHLQLNSHLARRIWPASKRQHIADAFQPLFVWVSLSERHHSFDVDFAFRIFGEKIGGRRTRREC